MEAMDRRQVHPYREDRRDGGDDCDDGDGRGGGGGPAPVVHRGVVRKGKTRGGIGDHEAERVRKEPPEGYQIRGRVSCRSTQ
jgi:hypothetical protein